MNHQVLRSLLIVLLVAAPILPGYDAITVASGGECGGKTPCKCGDTVVETRTLKDDPVTKEYCPCNGLIVKKKDKDVILNLENESIRGKPDPKVMCTDSLSAGIVVNDQTGVRVIANKGWIQGFEICVQGDVQVNGSHFIGLNLRNCGLYGMILTGDHNEVTGAKIYTTGPRAGIQIEGNHNTVSSSQATNGEAFGFGIVGDHNTVEGNYAKSNEFEGFEISGTGNTIINNQSYSSENGYGMLDPNPGLNTYSGNKCGDNRLGNYFPPGFRPPLCTR